ncbi:uncharacterized protein [Palaemon carinicauda]|uniref:uncharacterized protein n=1 Tax=Palaemon carinicauda TaxID=392227 RepID=UPI0035B570BF
MMSDDEIEEEILEDIEEPELSFSESLVESLPCLHLEGSDLPSLAADQPASKDASGDGTTPDEAFRLDWESEGDVEEEDVSPGGVPETDLGLASVDDQQEGGLRQISPSNEVPIDVAEIPSRPGSPDTASVSPIFSNLTDFSSGSHGSRNDLHNDRSLSEVSISIPKLAVVAVNSDQPVSSLVHQFSHRDLGLFSPSSKSSSGQFQSLPPCLDERSRSRPPAKSSTLYALSSPLGERAREGPRDKSLYKSFGNVANLINQFSVDSSEGKETSPKHSLPSNVLQPVVSSIASTKDVVLSLPNAESSHSTKNRGSLGDEIDAEKEPSLPAGDSPKRALGSVYVLPDDQGSASVPFEYGSAGASSLTQTPGGVSEPQNLELLCSIAFPGSASAGEGLESWNEERGDAREAGTSAENVAVDDDREQSPAPSLVKTSPEISLRCDDDEARPDGELRQRRKSVRCRPDSPYETNDTSEELLEIDIGESDQEMFSADLSDASEIILGFISKSPISAITERTEESAQEKSNSLLEEGDTDKSDRSLKCDEMEELKNASGDINKAAPTVERQGAPGPAGYFPSAFLSIENDAASSQFTGMSSMQGDESMVQHQLYSLGTASDTLHPSSSQSCQLNASKVKKPSPKTKLPTKLNVRSTLRASERCSTPPLSLHGQCTAPPGPLKTCLQRVTSKSMHNLVLGAGGKPRAPVLQNRSFSLSTDHLERQSPRAKSLSPGPGYEQRARSAADGRPHSSMARRCLSAVALNRTDSQASIKRNQSVSLSRLNRSRSSSMTSVSSWRRADYSHVSSKVKQYIRDMKDKDLRNSTRSLPATPAKKIHREQTEDRELRKIVLEELLLRDLSYLEEEEVPEPVLKLRNQIRANLKGAGQGDVKVLDQLLQLWAMERKLRYASDTTLAALQEHYNDLNTLYAEKQNEIDRLRFFKDVHVYREGFRSAGRGGDKRRLSYSCHNTPPATPHFQTSPNTPTRRLSVHTTPPNTPNAPSLSPSLLSNLNKTSSTQVADPSTSITLEANESSACTEGSPSARVPPQEGPARGTVEEVTLETWIKDANGVLRRVKEFALLEGSSALQQSERSVIWNGILNQYWRLSSQFPLLSLLPGSQQSGALVQNLGQAISGTASRFQLEIVPSRNESFVPTCGRASEVKDAEGPRKRGSDDSRDRSSQGKNRSSAEGSSNIRLDKNLQSDCLNENIKEEAKRKVEESFNQQVSAVEPKVDEEREDEERGNDPLMKVELMEHEEEVEELLRREDRSGIDNEAAAGKDEEDVRSPAPSPAPSHESMKTVGPLEKVTMWQESLIGSIVPHGSYHSSSNMSPAASLLSLGSSQPFEAGHLTDLDLKDFHPLHSSTALGHSGENEPGEDAGLALPLIDPGGELEDGAGNGLDKADSPQSAWKGGAATHHLALGRTVIKARDLDSGCPGSERSTKVSQIASLEMVEYAPEGSSLHPGEIQVKGTKLNGEGTCQEVPPSEVPNRDIVGETANDVGQEVEGRLENASDKEGDCDKENSSPRVTEGDSKSSSPRDDRGDVSEVKTTKERPKDRSSLRTKRAHRLDRPGGDDSKKEVASSRRPALGKYDEKYTSSQLSSTPSEKSTGSSRSSSSAEIHSNISRLKRDLNFLKSQMMNLTSEVLQDKRRISFSARRKDGVRTNVGLNPVRVIGRPDDSIPRVRYPSGSGQTSDGEPNSSQHVCKNDRLRNGNPRMTSSWREEEDDSSSHRRPPHLREVLGNAEGKHLRRQESSWVRSPRSPTGKSKNRMKKPPTDFISPGEFNSPRRSGKKYRSTGDVRGAATPERVPFAEKTNKVIIRVEEAVDDLRDQSERLVADGQLRLDAEYGRSRRRCRSSSPIIFIQNYNYGRSEGGKEPARGQAERTHFNRIRRSSSSQSLMASLDQATTLAERLRLRSQSMLTQLHLASTLTSRHLSGME